MQDATEVAGALFEIARLLAFAGEPRFRVQAYERSAGVVTALGADLANVIEQDRLRQLPGIGPALSAQIRELWNTGASAFLLRLRAEHPEGAAELVQLPGLTPRRIRALHAALGLRSVDELRAACAAGRVRRVPGFGVKTERRLLDACERWQTRTEPPPAGLLLPRALELAGLLQHELAQVADQVHLAGALRRGVELVHRIELVVCGDVDAALRRVSGLRQVLRVDHERRLSDLSPGVQLVLHPAPEADLGTVLLAATGNEAHVAAVRERARSRGLELRLDPTLAIAPSAAAHDTPAAPCAPATFASEAELYAALELPCVPPELRDGRGELEDAARAGFDDLVELGDVQGLVHCHTTYSDGRHGIYEMAAAAQALGMKYITITDHSPSAHYARGVSLDDLARQWDEIAAAQERLQIRILRGTESDILSDGRLDYPDAVLERFDVVIASIHARHRMDARAMTERLTRALSLPLFKIWGHGLGRILQHRDPIACDVPAVLDALAGSRGAVEINADPHRLDLPAEWIPTARARGIPFVISVDAHSTKGFACLPCGVTQARRGGVRQSEVLNTLPPDAFAARVRPV